MAVERSRDHVDFANDDSFRYQMNDFPRVGICLIIYNVDFHQAQCLAGGENDSHIVEKTFNQIGYEVIMHKNLTSEKMKQTMKEVSEKDHSQNASFVAVIVSHGSKDVVYGSDHEAVELDSLTQYFKGDRCKSLFQKPKLFFINACRGSMEDPGADTVDAGMDPSPVTYRIPVEADFLYAYSTSPGYISWMSSFGSFFIWTLCEMIEKHRDLELMQILTRVNAKEALDYTVSEEQSTEFGGTVWRRYKQMPSITSMLTKEFYFPKDFRGQRLFSEQQTNKQK